MKKLLFYIFFVVIVIFISYKYNEELNTFYLRTYYLHISQKTFKQHLNALNKLKKDEDFVAYKEYLERLLVVYPENRILNKSIGLYYAQEGNQSEALFYLVKALNQTSVDLEILQIIIPIMFEKKLYADILLELKKYSLKSSELIMYKGIAYYKTGKYNSAKITLNRVYQRNYSNILLYYYLGSSEYQLKSYKRSVLLLEKAYKMDPQDDEVRNKLIAAYNKAKMYKKAAYIIRKGFN